MEVLGRRDRNRPSIILWGVRVSRGTAPSGPLRPQYARAMGGDLPPGYRMREDADLLVVLRPDGSEVAAFSALGADPLEVIAAAWEDYE